MQLPSDADVISASLEVPGRFAALFDRHATTLFRFLVRRVGPDEADALLGDVFRIAFERRGAFDPSRPEARPWLYGIATNVVAKHRRREARRFAATARLVAAAPPTTGDIGDEISARLDAAELWPSVAAAIADLPLGERDALLLFAWEDLSYADIAAALDVPVGTVRSRINRARTRLRELPGAGGEQQSTHRLRPDRVLPLDEGDPGVFKREKENLMSMIDQTPASPTPTRHTPAMYPRLTYRDEVAALEHLTRVFQFVERREARMGGADDTEGTLAWLEFGDGVVMIGRATDAAREVHHLYSPEEVGHATVMINVAVHDIDAHYGHAVAEGARITMPIENAFYGFRRYEADDLEGHHWHFHESLAEVRARGGDAGDDTN